MLSTQTIQRVAQRHGYTFSDETCLDLLDGSFDGETIAAALIDYLSAYEGITWKAIKAIQADQEAEATE